MLSKDNKIEIISKKTAKSLHEKHNKLLDYQKGKSIRYKGNVNHFINYNVLTAIARLLSLNEVCGCAYLKNGEIFISTNLSEKEAKLKNRLVEKKRGGSKPQIDENFKSLRDEIGEIIYDLIKSDFSQENKTKLLQKVFSIKIFHPISIISSIKSKTELDNFNGEVANLMVSLEKFEDWNDDSFEKVLEIKKNIKIAISKNKNKLDSCLRKKVASNLTYIADVEEIMELDPFKKNENFYKEIRNYILKSGKKWSHRYNSVKDLHAELASLQRENENNSMDCVTKEVISASNEGNFAISKILCLICYNFFDSLREVYEKEKKENLDIEILGNSLTFFPGFKSPFLKNENFNRNLKNVLENKLKIVENKLELVDRKNQGLIETSLYSKYAIDEYSTENYEEFEDDYLLSLSGYNKKFNFNLNNFKENFLK